MTVSIAERIPCKYVVARYVEDEVRDEPINLGVILQSQENFVAQCKFITSFKFKSISSNARVKNTILKETLDRIEREVASHDNDERLLKHLVSEFNGKIKFTDVRSALAEDLDDEADDLFRRYVSIRYHESTWLPITHYKIKKTVSDYVRKLGRNIVTNYKIQGLTTPNRFDIAFIDKKRIFHAISFQELGAVSRTKLFDWSVKDSLGGGTDFHKDDFGAMITEPSPDKPRFETMTENYKIGRKILVDNGYALLQYDGDKESWKGKIKSLA